MIRHLTLFVQIKNNVNRWIIINPWLCGKDTLTMFNSEIAIWTHIHTVVIHWYVLTTATSMATRPPTACSTPNHLRTTGCMYSATLDGMQLTSLYTKWITPDGKRETWNVKAPATECNNVEALSKPLRHYHLCMTGQWTPLQYVHDTILVGLLGSWTMNITHTHSDTHITNEVEASRLVKACRIHGSRLPAWKRGKTPDVWPWWTGLLQGEDITQWERVILTAIHRITHCHRSSWEIHQGVSGWSCLPVFSR